MRNIFRCHSCFEVARNAKVHRNVVSYKQYGNVDAFKLSSWLTFSPLALFLTRLSEVTNRHAEPKHSRPHPPALLAHCLLCVPPPSVSIAS